MGRVAVLNWSRLCEQFPFFIFKKKSGFNIEVYINQNQNS